MDSYSYQPLDNQAREIRLLRLLPAENFDDEIEIEIFHTPLIEPEEKPDTRLAFEDLERTLPQGWRLYRTREERFVFMNTVTWDTQWTHPDPEFDRKLYHSDAVLDPNPDFEPTYEGKDIRRPPPGPICSPGHFDE